MIKLKVLCPNGEEEIHILDPDKDFGKQLNDFYGYGTHGITVEWHDTYYNIVDYYHDEVMATFKVISMEEC